MPSAPYSLPLGGDPVDDDGQPERYCVTDHTVGFGPVGNYELGILDDDFQPNQNGRTSICKGLRTSRSDPS